ncbi:MAG: DUF4974 domain-containing protein [Bacteroidales bacterium]|jgi:ferric-dicitrate binding protein FerR (iron transport regulator)|nr:DUF4974 domain-containing protein [Bacteroidales bacterium]
MGKVKNIVRKNKSEVDLTLDQILNQNHLDYADLNFNNTQPDVLKSFKIVNRKLGRKSTSIKNIISILPEIDFNPILKPVYTVILTCALIFSIIHYQELTEPVQYTQITVEKGEKINLHVTENLSVYVNSGSSIKIPAKLKRNSKIVVDGEAYFELKQKNDIKIIANGVEFKGSNSNFYINTKQQYHLTAQIFNGSVEFYNPVLPKSTRLHLKSNDKLTYISDSEFISVENDGNKNVIAWHTGKLNFEEERLQAVINEISEYFEIPMEIQDQKLSNRLYTATFHNQDVDEILDIIRHTFNCNISADGSKIIIN